MMTATKRRARRAAIPAPDQLRAAWGSEAVAVTATSDRMVTLLTGWANDPQLSGWALLVHTGGRERAVRHPDGLEAVRRYNDALKAQQAAQRAAQRHTGQLLDVTAAAARLGVQTATVSRLRRAGKLEGQQDDRGRWLYWTGVLDEYRQRVDAEEAARRVIRKRNRLDVRYQAGD